MAMPFVALAMMLQKDVKLFLFLDLCVMLVFIFFTVNSWADNVDETMLELGIFRSFVNEAADPELSLNAPSIMFWLKNAGQQTVQAAPANFNEYMDTNMDNLLNTGKMILGLCYTIISTYFLLYFIRSYPKTINDDLWEESAPGIEPLIRIRFYVGVLCFIVPAFICLIINL
ncbi:MAG: hypothetical protein LBF38_01110 [Deltaproteobacteria bacterium]|nr:hypothetical protein [Deltaproteobacteria bacterium]